MESYKIMNATDEAEQSIRDDIQQREWEEREDYEETMSDEEN